MKVQEEMEVRQLRVALSDMEFERDLLKSQVRKLQEELNELTNLIEATSWRDTDGSH